MTRESSRESGRTDGGYPPSAEVIRFPLDKGGEISRIGMEILPHTMTRAPHPRLLKIWEPPPNLKCPLVGTCLTDEEVAKLLKKAGCRIAGLNSFDLHGRIMARLEDENPASIRVDAYLRRKYRDVVASSAHLEEKELLRAWREALRSGEIDGLFYVSCLRPDLSTATAMEIYGDIHMMGHAHTREILRMRKKMAAREETIRDLRDRLRQARERFTEEQRAGRSLREELGEARLHITRLGAECMRLREREARREKWTPPTGLPDATGNTPRAVPALGLPAGVQIVEGNGAATEIRRLEAENRAKAREIQRLERERRKLQIDLFEIRTTNERLTVETGELLARLAPSPGCPAGHCNESCPEYPTCPRRVLIVGGITKLKHLYRDLVESRGGELDYHDGYVKTAGQDMAALVQRSDLVICPVNCNSHGACERVKRLCKKYDKPLKMLSSSSLSAIATALYHAN